MESIEEAAARLLAGLKRGKRPAGERPAEIQELDPAPVEKEAAEMAARVSASLSGQVARLGGLRRDAIFQASAANDNFADRTNRVLRCRARPVLIPDYSAAPKIALIHAPGNWEF